MNTSQQPPSQPSFNLSPASAHALSLYQNLLNRLFFSIAQEAERNRYSADDLQLSRMGQRVTLGFSYFEQPLRTLFSWLFTSREDTNFTYDLTDANKAYLASTIALVTGIAPQLARSYVSEPENDAALKMHISQRTAASVHRIAADEVVNFGRRLGWYAMVRALKPKVVVETGVDKGLGSCLLCAALARNAADGAPGYYYGTDINPQAGYLLAEPYSRFGKVLYGDSIASLQNLSQPIDLFINDSDHSADYEGREYETIKDRLSANAVVLGDNSHVTTKLIEFAQRTDRNFLFFAEKPKDHWYPGGGIGIAFRR